MKIGTPVAIGFYPGSQSHIDERYFNNGVPYASVEEAMATIPMISIPDYLTVNIQGVEYWFLPDGNLVQKLEYLAIANKAITLLKMADVNTSTVFYRRSSGVGPPEVQTLAQLKADLNVEDKNVNIQQHIADVSSNPHQVTKSQIGLGNCNDTSDADKPISTATQNALDGKQDRLAYVPENVGNKVKAISSQSTDDQYPSAKLLFNLLATLQMPDKIFTLTLPVASTVAGRCIDAVEGENYPTGWVIGASEIQPIDLLITHNLNRRIVDVKIYSVDGDSERLLYFNSAFSGLFAPDKNSLLIESLATIQTAIVIHLIFS